MNYDELQMLPSRGPRLTHAIRKYRVCAAIVFCAVWSLIAQAAVTTDNVRKWPCGIIPYQYGVGMDSDARNTFETAISMWQGAADIHFQRIPDGVISPNFPNFVVVRHFSGNLFDEDNYSEFAGMAPYGHGAQGVYLFGNNDLLIDLHEIGHLLGLQHEHARTNAVTLNRIYMYVNGKEITDDDFKAQMTLEQSGGNEVDLTLYDPFSVMHYPADADLDPRLIPNYDGALRDYCFDIEKFISNCKLTISPLIKPTGVINDVYDLRDFVQTIIGKTPHLSPGDKLGVSDPRMYGPPGSHSVLTVYKAGIGSGTALAVPSGDDVIVDQTNPPLLCQCFQTGTNTLLEAKPSADSVFDRWSGDINSASKNVPVTFFSSQSTTVTFDPVPPPPDNSGCWMWNPAVGQAGGYVWTCSKQPGGSLSSEVIEPGDPNDKGGTQGIGSQQYVTGRNALDYPISFGNESSASAAAQTVVISDPLNTLMDDLTTFAFGPIVVAGQVLFPPPGIAYSTTVDLRPGQNLLLGINANLNLSTGIVTWKFTSIDPRTGMPTTDPSAGFLPPGANGSVFFTVMPKRSLATGTQIQNQATIVFEPNPPMTTPTWLNTIDNTPPTSHVLALPMNEASLSFTVAWTGTDEGSGIQDYTICVSENGGACTSWLTSTTATSATYTGLNGHTYSFYSIARDLVGNVEPAKTTAEATTTVSTKGTTDSQIQLLLSTSAITYPESMIVTVKLFPGATPTHAPSGTIQLVLDGNTLPKTLSLSGDGHGYAAAYYDLSHISAGSHTLYAVYSGDANNPGGSSAPVSLLVLPAPVKLSVSCQNPTIVSGHDYKCEVYTAPISAGANTVITYQFDDSPPVAVPLSNGAATFDIPNPAVGQHAVVVSYAAQGNYAAAASQTSRFRVIAH